MPGRGQPELRLSEVFGELAGGHADLIGYFAERRLDVLAGGLREKFAASGHPPVAQIFQGGKSGNGFDALVQVAAAHAGVTPQVLDTEIRIRHVGINYRIYRL